MNRSESPSTALRAPSPPLGEKDGMRGVRFMESPHGFVAVHWDHEPGCGAQRVWCPAFRQSGPAKARRFMERRLGRNTSSPESPALILELTAPAAVLFHL